MKIFLFITVLLLHSSYAVVTHENEEVWRVFPQPHQFREMKQMVEMFEIDILSAGSTYVDLLITPKKLSLVKMHFRESQWTYNVMIPDLQKVIDEQATIRNSREKPDPSADIDVEVYHTLEEINAYIDRLVADFDFVSVESLGQTIEGRDIRMLTLSTKSNQNSTFIQCGIHAREWVSIATCIWGLDYLTRGYGEDEEVTSFLDSQDIFMIVSTNPDGYVYSWDMDRMWRKNRRINEGKLCDGVDLNRNYDESFGGPGSSSNSCGQDYRGEFAFSEPETRHISNKIMEIQKKQTIKAFYDLHAYGNIWLFPYGSRSDEPANYEDLDRAAFAGVKAISEVYGTEYQHGSIAVIFYVASGGSIDWTYEIADIPYSYGIEERDNGKFGFLLPEDQIVPTATEVWAGIFAANKEM